MSSQNRSIEAAKKIPHAEMASPKNPQILYGSACQTRSLLSSTDPHIITLHNGALTTLYAGAPSPGGFLVLHTSLTKPPIFAASLFVIAVCNYHYINDYEDSLKNPPQKSKSHFYRVAE